MADERVAVSESASSESPTSLADILGTGEAQEPAGTSRTPGAAAEDFATTEEPGETADRQAGVEAGAEEAPEAEAAEADESQLAPEEGEMDYADEVYTRYAKHYSNQWKIPLNPEDPATRLLLREVIQRGENFRRLQAEAEATQAEAETVEESADEPAAAAALETPEQVQAFLKAVDQFVEPRVRPEVAQSFLADFMQALWPDQWKKMAGKVSPEVSRQFTKGMMKFGYLFLNDALPEILESYVPGMMGRAYPGFERVSQDAVFEQAYDAVAGKTSADGRPVYPELDELVDNDAFDVVYDANPWLRDHRFADKNGRLLHPVEQEARRLEVAIALARGQRLAPELLKQAVEKGKQQVKRAQNQAALGKLAPGESRGEFGQVDSDSDALMKGMYQFGDRERAVQDMLAPKKS